MRYLYHSISSFNEVSPHHPLFALESRRVRRLLHSHELNRLMLKVSAIVLGLLAAWWLLAALGDMGAFSPRGYPYYPSIAQMLSISFVISLLADGILDFACMVASVNTFAGEVISGRWDLLRLTIIPAEQIAAVKHAAARLRAWRMTTIVFAIRLAVIILAFLNWVLTDGLRYFRFRFEDTFIFLSFLVAAVTYLIEPFWRARAVTALGLDISIRLRSSLSVTLSAIGSVLALWILQPIIIGGIFYCFGTTFLGMLFYNQINSFVTGIIVFFIALFIAAVFYGFYAALCNISISNLINRLVRYEG